MCVHKNNKAILLMRLKEKQSFQEDESFKLEKDPVLQQIKPIFKAYEKMGMITGDSQALAKLFIAGAKGMFYVYLLDDKRDEEVEEAIALYIDSICNGIVKK